MLVKFGGEPLKTQKNEGYWADGAGGLVWMIDFNTGDSDYYNQDEKAYVRPIIFVED